MKTPPQLALLGPYILAAHLARRLKCSTIVDLDCRAGDHLDVLAEAFELVATENSYRTRNGEKREGQKGVPVRWIKDMDSLSIDLLSSSVVVSPSRHEDKKWTEVGLPLLSEAAASVWTLSSQEGQGSIGSHTNITRAASKSFCGRYSLEAEGGQLIGVMEKAPSDLDAAPPPSFQVVAIVTTFNEADLIEQVIEHLISQGVLVYLIDNWSTDNTMNLTSRYLGRGVVHMERFPPEGPEMYGNWEGLLRRVEEVASRLEASWVLHHDADEIRRSPWADVSLRDAIYRVDQSGFNAIDHTVVNFPPPESRLSPTISIDEDFRVFERESHASYGLQVKAWKCGGSQVSLASGGHDVLFPGKRVYPFNFLIQHYPIRSQDHGSRKVFRERVFRWRPQERALGWHNQYDDVGSDHDFLNPGRRRYAFKLERFFFDHFVDRVTGTLGDRTPLKALRRVVDLARQDHGSLGPRTVLKSPER